jgi:hypothetical protein
VEHPASLSLFQGSELETHLAQRSTWGETIFELLKKWLKINDLWDVVVVILSTVLLSVLAIVWEILQRDLEKLKSGIVVILKKI